MEINNGNGEIIEGQFIVNKMIQKTISLYKYNELSKEAQEKVLSHFQENNDFYFLEESLNELLSEKLEKNKIKIIDGLQLYYSLSYSQGDGACFTGNFQWKGYDIRIKKAGSYCHEYSADFYISHYDKNHLGFEDEEEEANEGIYEKFKELYRSICCEIKEAGYENIEYENSEEAIKENIESNEYTFREDGEIENE